MTQPDFDPYRVWLGIPPSEQPPNHYQLLGIGLFESDVDAISGAADRQMAHVRTFQAGERSALSQTILNQLSQARICLLDPARKAEYDRKLRSEPVTEPPPLEAPVPPPKEPPPPAAEPEVPGIATAPALIRARAAGVRIRRKRKTSWVGPALLVILVTILLGVLVVLIHRLGSSSQPRGSGPAPARGREKVAGRMVRFPHSAAAGRRPLRGQSS